MKILIISSFLPYPLFSGGHVRLFNLIKELSAKHTITLVCEKRSHQSEKDIEVLKKYCEEVITIERKKQWSTENVLKATVSSYPFLLVGHTLPEMKEKLVMLLRDKKFDVVHVETFYVFQNVPKTYLPIVLVEHNIEYNVYQRFANTAPLLLRPLLAIDIEKIKFWEKNFWKRATTLVAVSEKEKIEMRRSDVSVVPNGVDLNSFPFKKKSLVEQKTKTILFLGDFKWIQNRKAVEWILKEIWPKINFKFKISNFKLKLWIVGKHIPETIKQHNNKTIIIDEKAPDKTSDIYKKADILIAPIQVGGGTSYKILEAMASGVPVVTTRLGMEGLGGVNQREALVAEDAEGLADNVLTLLTKPELYEKIRNNARKLIEKQYSWEKIAQALEHVYESAINKEKE